MACALQLHLFGEPALQLAQGPRVLLSRKDAALLALLALEGAMSRDRLVTLLWPNTPSAAAQASLRQRVHRLRRAGAEDLVQFSDRVRLGDGVVQHAAAQSDANALVEQSQRLPGLFEYDAEPELAAWVNAARERHRAQRVDACMALAARLEQAGQLAPALEQLGQVLLLEPPREHAWRTLMRLHYSPGGPRLGHQHL